MPAADQKQFGVFLFSNEQTTAYKSKYFTTINLKQWILPVQLLKKISQASIMFKKNV